MNKKTYTEVQLIDAVKESTSIHQICLKLGLSGRGGGSHYSVLDHIKRLNLDTSHLKGQAWCKGKKCDWKKKPIEFYCNIRRPFYNAILKRKFLEYKIIKDECAICGCKPFWNEEKLNLQLDHIDGNRSNNLPENLRLLCPNCHSQTPNFAGRGIKKVKKEMKKNTNWRRQPKLKQRKVERPPYNILISEVNKTNYSQVGKKYGVSDNAIRKWIRFYEGKPTGGKVSKISLPIDFNI